MCEESIIILCDVCGSQGETWRKLKICKTAHITSHLTLLITTNVMDFAKKVFSKMWFYITIKDATKDDSVDNKTQEYVKHWAENNAFCSQFR